MQSIGSQAGFCQKHQMDKMFVGNENATEPTCIRCDADARPKEGRTVIAEDPGDGFFNGRGTNAKITVVDPDAAIPVHSPAKDILAPANKLEDVVAAAVAQLKRLPMPEDIKQFKAVQKAIKTLESLTEK